MTTPHDSGGLAYPSIERDLEAGHYEGRYEVTKEHPGMTLRDKYVGDLVAATIRSIPENSVVPTDNEIGELVHVAGRFADVMIAEKRRREGE